MQYIQGLFNTQYCLNKVLLKNFKIRMLPLKFVFIPNILYRTNSAHSIANRNAWHVSEFAFSGNLPNYILTTRSFSLAITGRNLFSGNIITMADWLILQHSSTTLNYSPFSTVSMYYFLLSIRCFFLKKTKQNRHKVMSALYSTIFFKNKSFINIYDNL